MYRIYVLNIILFAVILYFTFYSFYGSRGYFAYGHVENNFNRVYEDLNRLRSERFELLNQIRLLQDNSWDKDLLDEYTRRILGYVNRTEYFFHVENI